MASAITNRFLSSSLLLAFVFILNSCTVKYFSHDIKGDIQNISDSGVNAYLPDGFPDKMDVYSLQMNATYIYKNNVRENMLMTKNSQHLDRVLFFENNDPGMPEKFQRFEVWLARKIDFADTLRVGENAVMVSYKGKKSGAGKEEYELVKVFFGSLKEKNVVNYHKNKITTFSPEYLLEYTGKSTKCAIKKCKQKDRKSSEEGIDSKVSSEDKNCISYCNVNSHKIKRKKIKKHGKTALNMEAIIELKKEKVHSPPRDTMLIQIGAIINNNYSHFAAEKSMIFDLTQIYGEPVWLLKN